MKDDAAHILGHGRTAGTGDAVDITCNHERTGGFGVGSLDVLGRGVTDVVQGRGEDVGGEEEEISPV